MKCGEPKPGDSWRECDKRLKHDGDHRYLNETWPRPVPALPNPDVANLLEETLPPQAWGVNERSYPIVVVETVTRVLWVDAENEDDALAYWANDWSETPLKEAHVLSGDLEFRRLEEFERQEAHEAEMGRQFGPHIQCPGCGAFSFRRSWYHRPLRKCHGPIKWQETRAPNPRWRWSRVHESTPGGESAC